MNPEPADRDDVEALIRGYLRDQEATVDARGILDRTRAKLARAGRAGPRPARSALRWAAWAAAAALILGSTWTFRQSSARADAVRLVREAREALGTASKDRAYRIGIDLAPGRAQRSPYLAALAGFDCRLWTRGDRFRIEGRRDSQVWATGRDETRQVWVEPSPGLGLIFTPEEVPEPLDEAFDLFHLDLDSVLHVLATDFDVTPLGDATAGVTRIKGTPRVGSPHPRPRLRSITVEIDEATRTVRQIILSRVREGRPLAEVSFTFEEAGTQPDASYRLASRLEPGGIIHGPDHRLRRRRELSRFFGSLLLKGE